MGQFCTKIQSNQRHQGEQSQRRFQGEHPILEESGLIAGKDFALAYSPEREDPGNIDFETSTIPKLVGADTEDERSIT